MNFSDLSADPDPVSKKPFDWNGFIIGLVAILGVLLPVYFLLTRDNKPDIANYSAGIAAYERGDYPAAEQSFKLLYSLYSSPVVNLTVPAPAAHYHVGLCYLAEGKKENAVQEFNYVIQNTGGKSGGMFWDGKAREMLAWMNRNSNWEPSPQDAVPPFPAIRDEGQ